MQGSKMTLLDETVALSEGACCHACRGWGPSVSAWPSMQR